MQANAGLNAGLFVGGNDELVTAQGFILPAALVEIQHPSGFLGEVLVPGKNPTAMLPGPNRIGVQPAPDGRATDLRDNPAGARVAHQLLSAEAPRRGIVAQ